MNNIDKILEAEKEVTSPPSLSRQANIRGALGPGAFPVSSPGHRDRENTGDDGDSLSVYDEEQPSASGYLVEATTVPDGNIICGSDRCVAVAEVYEGRIIMPSVDKNVKKRPVCRRSVGIAVIAVAATAAIVLVFIIDALSHAPSQPAAHPGSSSTSEFSNKSVEPPPAGNRASDGRNKFEDNINGYEEDVVTEDTSSTSNPQSKIEVDDDESHTNSSDSDHHMT